MNYDQIIRIGKPKHVKEIITALHMNPMGFNDIQRAIEINNAPILQRALKHLEEEGIVVRKNIGGIRVQYSLTYDGVKYYEFILKGYPQEN